MSGGSMGYLCDDVDSAGASLLQHSRPAYRTFGAYLLRVAKALHDVEWAMSCDISHEEAEQSVADLLSGGSVKALDVADMNRMLDDVEARVKALRVEVGP